MAFRDYIEGSHELAIQPSEAESRASGLSVGRLYLGNSRYTSGYEVMRCIQKSNMDIVIVRTTADKQDLAARLHSRNYTSWQADTLLYFDVLPRHMALDPRLCALVKLGPVDEPEALTLMRRTFAGYRNHYSATPALASISVEEAYVDWTRSALQQREVAMYKSMSANDEDTGVCLIDTENSDWVEILLAGTLPEYRGRGAYLAMISELGRLEQVQTDRLLVISTQASNIGVMRAWTRLGFRPRLALNTIHVVHRRLCN